MPNRLLVGSGLGGFEADSNVTVASDGTLYVQESDDSLAFSMGPGVVPPPHPERVVTYPLGLERPPHPERGFGSSSGDSGNWHQEQRLIDAHIWFEPAGYEGEHRFCTCCGEWAGFRQNCSNEFCSIVNLPLAGPRHERREAQEAHWQETQANLGVVHNRVIPARGAPEPILQQHVAGNRSIPSAVSQGWGVPTNPTWLSTH